MAKAAVQIQIRIKTNTEAKTREIEMLTKGSLVEHLAKIGVEFPESHPCRRYGGCSTSMDYNAQDMITTIKHRLGDRLLEHEVSDILRDSAIWPQNVMNELGRMHMSETGIYRDGDSYKAVTPYIDPSDAIEMASEIYGHTGERVTIPAGRKTYGNRASTRRSSIKEKKESEWQRKERERGPLSEGEVEARNNMY